MKLGHSTVKSQDLTVDNCSIRSVYNALFNRMNDITDRGFNELVEHNGLTFGSIFDHSSRSLDRMRIQPGRPSASLCSASSVSDGVYASSSSSSNICIFSSFPIISLPAQVIHSLQVTKGNDCIITARQLEWVTLLCG